jgi:hypothetical protein
MMLHQENELLKKYSRKIMVHRYFNFLPKKQLLKII